MGEAKKRLAAANGLENIRQTPPSALAPFPRPGYFSPRAAAGFAATPWQAEIRLGSVRHLPAPPAPRRAPFAEKTACTPGRTPFLGACSPASRFTERRGGGRPDQLLNRSPAVTSRYPRASLTRGGFLAPCETDIRKKIKARSPDLLPSSSSASDEKKLCNYLTKDYQSYMKPE